MTQIPSAPSALVRAVVHWFLTLVAGSGKPGGKSDPRNPSGYPTNHTPRQAPPSERLLARHYPSPQARTLKWPLTPACNRVAPPEAPGRTDPLPQLATRTTELKLSRLSVLTSRAERNHKVSGPQLGPRLPSPAPNG
ncbi:hypothetical protein U1Q18_052852 [Sarracenia purpurea var. burkii]